MKTLFFWRITLFAVTIGCASSALAQDIIIESGKGCQNSDHYKEIKGDWRDSDDPQTEKSHAPGLPDAAAGCVARKIPPGTTSEARYYPKFTKAGHYCVYVTWPKAANAKQVVYIAKYGSGQGPRAISQNGTAYHNPSNADRWIYLGEYDFNAGDDQYIAILTDATNTTANDPGKNGAVFADAVRFTLNPLTPADGAELLPRDRVELRALPGGVGVPAGAVSLLAAAPAKPEPPVKKTAPVKTEPLAAITVTPAETKPPLTAALVGDSSPVKWGSDLAEAQKQAAAQPGKRILIYFHSAESILCTNYDTTVFTNPDVVKLIQEKYVPVKLEMEQNSEMAAKLNIFRSGILLVYDSAGNGIKKIEQLQSAADLLKELQF